MLAYFITAWRDSFDRSLVIDDIEDHFREESGLAFIYFDYKNIENSAMNVVANLLMQVISRFDEILSKMLQIFNAKRRDPRHFKWLQELADWILMC
jgi:hypothetical protein